MELYTLGSGNAFTKKNWQSNFLIRQNKKWLMIDCGSFAPLALNEEMGLSEVDIDAVYISHIHADHVGGLEALAFCTFFNPTIPRPKMFIQGQYIIQDDNQSFASGLARDLWSDSLQGGLRGLETEDAQLHTYFDVNPVQENGHFIWEGIKFDMVQTVHVSARYKIENSYGLMWTDPDTNERIYITTDTQFCPVNAMTAYLKECDVIFHDCETSLFPSNVHASYERLRELPDEIKAKMWLYHYHDNVIDNWDLWSDKAEADGFRGFVKTGAIFGRTYTEQEGGSVGKRFRKLQ
jgi:ribonuclease BN (tRNA processing enzyme)